MKAEYGIKTKRQTRCALVALHELVLLGKVDCECSPIDGATVGYKDDGTAPF